MCKFTHFNSDMRYSTVTFLFFGGALAFSLFAQPRPGMKPMSPPSALESAAYSDDEKALIREVAPRFVQRRYEASNGVAVSYNLFVPEGYDSTQSYPLVLFVHDAGALSENPVTTLYQGTGAVSFASPADQERHPAFVVAPQYAEVLTSAESDQGVATFEMLDSLCREFNIDRDRMYNTGQSMGGMFALSTNIAHPDLFAASYLVACQWPVEEFYRFAQKPMWVVVAEGDPRAYPGMQEAMQAWSAAGAKIAEAEWDGSCMEDCYTAAVDSLMARDANIRFAHFTLGTVKSEHTGSPAAEHMASWPVAYRISGIRDWLFTQSKSRMTRADSIAASLRDADGGNVLVVAERGDWHGTQECSLHAILKAIEKGAAMVELPVRLTADSVAVCYPDATVDRLMNGTGRVADMTLDELQSLTPKEYRGGTTLPVVPTLRDAIDFCRGRIMIMLRPEDLTAVVEREVKDADATDMVLFAGTVLPEDEALLRMPLVDLDGESASADLASALGSKPVAVELRYASDDNPMVAEAFSKCEGEVRICVNTIQGKGYAGSHHDTAPGDDADREWGELIRSGATIIISDQIKPLLRYLSE